MSVLSMREGVPCSVMLNDALLLGLKIISQKWCEWEYGTNIKEIYVHPYTAPQIWVHMVQELP